MTKQKFMKRAERLGLKVRDDWIQDNRIIVDAPEGHVFVDRNIHWLEVVNEAPGILKKSNAYQYLYDDMIHGIEPCDITNCEYCHE